MKCDIIRLHSATLSFCFKSVPKDVFCEMKSSEVASRYGLYEFEVEKYIREHAEFPYKENFFGSITFSDDVDIDTFIQPLLLKKKETEQKIINNRLLQQQKEQEEFDKQERLRQEKDEIERKQREAQYCLRLENLRKRNVDGYYEYKVISLADVSGMFKKNSGRVDIETMTQELNNLGLDGWHLVTAYSNELGKNALSGGVGGALMGVNSTVDENILIFERFVKI